MRAMTATTQQIKPSTLNAYMTTISDGYKNLPQGIEKRPYVIRFLDDLRKIFTLSETFTRKQEQFDTITKLLALEGMNPKEIDHLFNEAREFERKNAQLVGERLQNEGYEALYLPEDEPGEEKETASFRHEWRHDIHDQDEIFFEFKKWQTGNPGGRYPDWLKENAHRMKVPNISQHIWQEHHDQLIKQWQQKALPFKKLYEHIYDMVPKNTKATINDYSLEPKSAIPF